MHSVDIHELLESSLPWSASPTEAAHMSTVELGVLDHAVLESLVFEDQEDPDTEVTERDPARTGSRG